VELCEKGRASALSQRATMVQALFDERFLLKKYPITGDAPYRAAQS
jgi:hypothetical protein